MHTHFDAVHQLDNLVWVFSVNYWDEDSDALPDRYYPGDDVVDVVGVDIYVEHGHAYTKRVYDHLRSLGNGKPVAITENGEILDWDRLHAEQPTWAFYNTWHGFEDHTSDAKYQRVFAVPGMVTLER